jgi:4'-phosphopantetheinyl transferase
VAIEVYRIPLATPARPGCADHALRVIVERVLGRIPELAATALGKPYVVGAGALDVSVSHSGRWALVAVRADGPVGVDVEEHRAMTAPSIAARFFTPGEAALVAAATDQGVFFRIWTRKEAWTKAQGQGLRLPLDEVDVSDDVGGWTIADVHVAPGYSAAVAWPGGADEVRVVDFTPA